MSISLPSKETIIIDVPDVKGFNARFQYNFFVNDEAVSTKGGVPIRVLERPMDTFDTAYIDQISSRVPRFVRFDFSSVVIQSQTDQVTDNEIRERNLRITKRNRDYIRRNLDKVLDEDFFASENFTAINLNDQSIDTKLFQIISGTSVFLTEDLKKEQARSLKSLAKDANTVTSDSVQFQFLSKYLVQPSETNAFFYDNNSKRIRNVAVNRLKDMHLHMQVNNKFFNNIVSNALVFPLSTFNSSYISLYNISRTAQQNALARTNTDMIHDEYKTVAQHVDAKAMGSNTSTVHSSAKMIGYIIDKKEVLANGETKILSPIVIESPDVSTAVDIQVKYYSTYIYSIRSVAEFTMPAIVEDTNELVVAKFLISSRPSAPIRVECTENVPPPSPTDFNFHWNFDANRLGISWTFPPNPQRDVKKFQVFRRKTIYEPFQLLKIYDFDDSAVKAPARETYFPELIEKKNSPTLVFVDFDFSRDSKFIYALCAIDAHGLTSNYSEQFEVSFDRFKNRIVKTRISPSGAPKPYPNMYLLADTFVDSILDNHHKTMKVAFTPDHLTLFDSNRRNLRLLATSNTGGVYKFLILNTDLQKEQILNVTVSDMRMFGGTNLQLSKKPK